MRIMLGGALGAAGAAGAAGLLGCAGSQEKGPATPPGATLAGIVAAGLHRKEGGGFRNPFASRRPPGGPWRLLQWKLFSKNRFKHLYDQEVVRPVKPDWDRVRESPATSLTFIKHSSLLIKHQGEYFLVDPVFKDMFPFITDFAPLGFKPEDMPRPDHFLVTHGHYDHLSEETLALFDPGAHVISPLGYGYVFDDLGMNNRTQLDWLQKWQGKKAEVILLPANHWTMRNPLMGPNRSLWGAFLVKLAGGPTIFISGDAAWFEHYQELAQYGEIDLAVFNLGAYEPRWFMKHSHMNPAEVAKAFGQIGAKKLLVVHWGAYRLGDEPVFLPPLDMAKEMTRLGLAERFLRLAVDRTPRT